MPNFCLVIFFSFIEVMVRLIVLIFKFKIEMQKSSEHQSRVRGNNFSKEEELSLVKTISRYKHIIENRNSDQITPRQKEEAWQKIRTEFNSCNNVRTLAQIKSKYDNLKTAARKYVGNINRNLYGTGGGPAQPPNSKNMIYDEVIHILNKKTVNGLSNIYDDDNIIIDGNTEGNTISENIEIVLDQGENEEIQDQFQEIEDEENILPSTSKDITESRHSWETYTPKMLREPKNKKLAIRNKPSPKCQEAKTFFALKQQYIEQKIQNLKNEDKRKEERHVKEMELLEVEMAKKRRINDSY